MNQELEQNGFVNLGRLHPDLDTQSVAEQLGKVISIPSISLVQKLSPKAKDPLLPNTYSGNYGVENFPLHTDLAHWHKPPRYFILRCVVPDPNVTTLVINFKSALREVPESIIRRALFRPRRRLDNKLFFLRFSNDDLFRWDKLYIVPENEEAKEIARHIENIKPELHQKVCLAEKGQVVLIDNWKVLHGRGAVMDTNSQRVIERIYLNEVKL